MLYKIIQGRLKTLRRFRSAMMNILVNIHFILNKNSITERDNCETKSLHVFIEGKILTEL